MKIISAETGKIVVDLRGDEAVALMNCIRQAVVDVDEWEFDSIIGLTSDEMRLLWSRLGDISHGAAHAHPLPPAAEFDEDAT